MAATVSAATEAVARSVDALVQARRGGRATSAAAVPLPDADAAYAVQAGVARALGWFGDAVAMIWKSGAATGLLRRTHAPLPPAGVWRSPANADEWPLHLRGIEAEIALRIGRDVDAVRAASLDDESAGALVDAMCVSIELVDSRWTEGLDAPPLNALADLQSHGALVLGDWVPYARRDWSAQACRVQIGSKPVVERRGSHALGDPARLLAEWMRHATRGGGTLAAGSVVTTGSWVGILPATAGESVNAEFPGVGVASIRL